MTRRCASSLSASCNSSSCASASASDQSRACSARSAPSARARRAHSRRRARCPSSHCANSPGAKSSAGTSPRTEPAASRSCEMPSASASALAPTMTSRPATRRSWKRRCRKELRAASWSFSGQSNCARRARGVGPSIASQVSSAASSAARGRNPASVSSPGRWRSCSCSESRALIYVRFCRQLGPARWRPHRWTLTQTSAVSLTPSIQAAAACPLGLTASPFPMKVLGTEV